MGREIDKGRKWLNLDLVAKHPGMNIALKNYLNAIDKQRWVADYFDWLNRELNSHCLDGTNRREILDRLISPTICSYEEALAELVYIALWNNLKWRFRKNPEVGGKTPDFGIYLGPQETLSFYSDVTVVRHNQPHHHTLWDEEGRIWVDGKLVDRLPTVTEPIVQDHRIGMKIEEKARKYEGLTDGLPLVVCLFIYDFENNFYMDRFQVENAVYGHQTIAYPSAEIFFKPMIKATEHDKEASVGKFAFEENKHVHSLIVCRDNPLPLSLADAEIGQSNTGYKMAYEFIVYANPFSTWARVSNNPLAAAGLPVYGLNDEGQLERVEPKTIAFY